MLHYCWQEHNDFQDSCFHDATTKFFLFAPKSSYLIAFPGNYWRLIEFSASSWLVLFVPNNSEIPSCCISCESLSLSQSVKSLKCKCTKDGRRGGRELQSTRCLCSSINIALRPWSHEKLLWRAHRLQRGDGEKTSACRIKTPAFAVTQRWE